MKHKLNKKQAIAIVLLLVAGIVLAGLILRIDKAPSVAHEHGHAEANTHADQEHHGSEAKDGHADAEHHVGKTEPARGSHGGKLFSQNGYGVELIISERGVEPQFRLYTYRDGKPLDPKASQVKATLERLGRKPQVFAFVPEKDYLRGDAVVEEPHSFKLTIDAQYAGKAYHFGHEQVEARVAMSDTQLKANRVEVLTAGPARIPEVLRLIGEVRFNDDRTVHVVPQLAGIVRTVSANAGDRVRKGQVLATISSQSLADQRAELLAAQNRLALARTTFEREKTLWEDKISAEQDYLQARTALQEAQIAEQNARQKLASLGSPKVGSDFTRYELRSPIDGIVVEKHIVLGEALKDDATVFVIADLSTVWVEMMVHAKDLNAVKIGQKATIKATAFDFTSSGAVFYVSSLMGGQSRAAKARIALPNPEGIWRSGLPVNVELVVGEVEVPVAVSQEAIQTVRDWTVIFGRYGDQFEARPVELGRSDGQFVEVVAGLNAGERYAAKNSFIIKAELGKADARHNH